MEREGYLHALQGSASLLVFGADKVIVSFDWDRKSFTWIVLQKCLNKLDFTHREQFVGLCLLSGSSILPLLPELDMDSPMPKLQAARSFMARHNNDADAACHNAKDQSYHALFHKARFAVKHPVVITTDGKVEPLNWESGPSDAHEFIGQRLPEELYYYLSRGVTGPRVLNWRTSDGNSGDSAS